MKTTLFVLRSSMLFLFLLPFAHCSSGKSDNRFAELSSLILDKLAYEHYRKLPIDDSFSTNLFALYLGRLDSEKKFLLQADVDQLATYDRQLDDQLKSGSDVFFKLSTELLAKRISQAKYVASNTLLKPFDFSVKESFEVDGEKRKYASSETEFNETWRKLLKYRTLIRLMTLLEAQETNGAAQKSVKDLEKEARESVIKNINKTFDRLGEDRPEDKLAAFFDSVVHVFDPHSDYMPPEEKAKFEIQMSGKLEGIGAQLVEEDGYIKVEGIIPGSPSYRGKELKPGDLILKVGQGSGEPVDIVDARVGDAVHLIRGPKGTEVRLTVKKPDGRISVISIIRDVIVIEETYAKSTIIQSPTTGRKYGYIFLPGFYNDMQGGRSSSGDVQEALEAIQKNANVDGIILDLRNNGGGYLDDAVRMAGLFYPVGPVVQVRSRNQSIESLDDREPSVSYAGPLVVMVNAASASASEIVAAALQDYGRAVVVGGSHTFGKGTVQKFDRFLSRDHELGAIKYTTQKFYRINGGSTQYLGVIPDIHLPDFTENYGITEKTLQNSLPWDTILPASYSKWPMPPNLKALSESSSARVSKDQHFAALQEILAYQNKRQKNTIQDLELAGARAEQKNMIEESKRFKDLKPTAEAKCLPLESYEDLPEDIRKQKENLRKEWFSQISGDLILSETLNVLSDMKK